MSYSQYNEELRVGGLGAPGTNTGAIQSGAAAHLGQKEHMLWDILLVKEVLAALGNVTVC